MRVGLFTTEIYANWVRKEELERWVYGTKFSFITIYINGNN